MWWRALLTRSGAHGRAVLLACVACEGEIELTAEARCARGGGTWEMDGCNGGEDACGRVACETAIAEGCHCPDGMCFDGLACVGKKTPDGLPVEVVGDDPCVGLGYDACVAMPAELRCLWYYQVATCQGSVPADIGCRSQLSRCDAGADCLEHDRCARECPTGSFCEPFLSPGGGCSGSFEAGTGSCYEASPPPCTEMALCRPSY
jgi:hypothetical protein